MKDDIYKYTSPKVTVDIAMFSYNLDTLDLDVLLIERENEPFEGLLSLPGGFIHENETALETAQRVLLEKTGITDLHIEQVKTFDEFGRDPRGHVFSITYLALINQEVLPEGLDKQKIKSFPFKKILNPKTSLAFDHKHIISESYKRLRSKITYSNISTLSLPSLFTLPEIQTLFEIILDTELDKRNFRKKIVTFDFIQETEQFQKGKSKKPARLYKNKYKKIVHLDRTI